MKLTQAVILVLALGFGASGDPVEIAVGGAGESDSMIPTGDAEICQFGNFGQIKSVKPSGTPNYFFRTFDRDGHKYVSFAALGRLVILDLDTGAEKTFNGDYDPVPMGHDIMTKPGATNLKEDVVLMPLEAILNGNSDPDRIEVGGEYGPLGGTYQSVGQLKEEGGKTTYRVLTDMVKIADYEIGGTKDKPTASMLAKPARVCAEQSFDLPMLSKDGTMVSGCDYKSGTTKIWKIDPVTKSCKEILDLGIATGKADFSYDGKKVIFHSTGTDPHAYFDLPLGTRDNMNVYEFNLETKKMKMMTQNPQGVNSYYPVYRPDGTIVYSQVSLDGPEFIHADPQGVPEVSTMGGSVQAQLALGELWSKTCLGGLASENGARATALTLDPDKCKKLVSAKWKSFKDDAKNELAKLSSYSGKFKDLGVLPEEAVAAACPKTKTEYAESKQKFKPSDFHMSPGLQIMLKKCSICHSEFNYNELKNNLPGPEIVAEMIKRLHSTDPEYKMPAQGSVTPDEVEEIIKFVSGK